MQTYIHAYIHTYIHTYLLSYIHTYIHTDYITLHYTPLHYITLQYIHTYIHINQYIYMCVYVCIHSNVGEWAVVVIIWICLGLFQSSSVRFSSAGDSLNYLTQFNRRKEFSQHWGSSSGTWHGSKGTSCVSTQADPWLMNSSNILPTQITYAQYMYIYMCTSMCMSVCIIYISSFLYFFAYYIISPNFLWNI